MTDKPFLEDEVDEQIRSSLLTKETPHPAIQAALIHKIHSQESNINIPWWMFAVIGGMQTAAFVAVICFLLPGSLFSYLAIIFGGGLILCASVLSGFVRKAWNEKGC